MSFKPKSNPEDEHYWAEQAREGARILDGVIALFGLYKDDDYNVMDRAYAYLRTMHEDEAYGVPLTVGVARRIEARALLTEILGG